MIIWVMAEGFLGEYRPAYICHMRDNIKYSAVCEHYSVYVISELFINESVCDF